MSMETVYNTRGRPLMFTPERMDQIKNLVERGQSREEIAAIIGCTPNSLAVTCSRLGISLRRPKLSNGVVARTPLRAADPPKSNGPPPPPQPPADNNDNEVAPAASPLPQPTDTVMISVVMEYHGQRRQTDVTLPADVVTQLILEAEIRGLRLTELLAKIIIGCIDQDFLKNIRNNDNDKA